MSSSTNPGRRMSDAIPAAAGRTTSAQREADAPVGGRVTQGMDDAIRAAAGRTTGNQLDTERIGDPAARQMNDAIRAAAGRAPGTTTKEGATDAH